MDCTGGKCSKTWVLGGYDWGRLGLKWLDGGRWNASRLKLDCGIVRVAYSRLKWRGMWEFRVAMGSNAVV